MRSKKIDAAFAVVLAIILYVGITHGIMFFRQPELTDAQRFMCLPRAVFFERCVP